jgi:4-diphosphocytidyl-2-C-methyl-D-erythritol kinase
MSALELAANAKINLSLDVLGKREDGYHELRMIMQTIALHDTVRIEAIPEGIVLECGSGPVPKYGTSEPVPEGTAGGRAPGDGTRRWVPEDRTNTAWKAAELLKNTFGMKSGIKIKIVKRIPVAAGLAGGSSDAAAVLRGVNELFSLGLGNEELKRLGRQIGADVPYCVEGGTRLAEGIGERLTALPDFSGVEVVLVKPRVGVSTAWVYGNLKTAEISGPDRPDTELLKRALEARDIKGVAANMKNVLEKVTIPRYDVVRQAKDKLLKYGACGSMMSGSGPTAFGLFEDSRTAAAAFEKLAADKRWQCFRTKTTGGSAL